MDMVEYMLHEMASYTKEDVRAGILGLQLQMQAMPEALPSASCPVKHIFAPGVYAREITMPAGMLVVGKLHRHAHLNTISKGRVKVLTECGVLELKAPCTFVSEVGTKRVVYVLEDTVWTTVHITPETDLATIEKQIIAEHYSDIELTGECTVEAGELCLGSQ